MRTGRFTVEIDDVEVAGWQRVAIPSSSTEQGEYREGNDADYEKKLWGGTSFDDLEMERGVKPGDTRIHEWRNAVMEGRQEEGRKTIRVTVQDEEGQSLLRWEFTGAWIKVYEPPTLEASADEGDDVATESITVAFDEMKREEV